jgi:hypothetical protein
VRKQARLGDIEFSGHLRAYSLGRILMANRQKAASDSGLFAVLTSSPPTSYEPPSFTNGTAHTASHQLVFRHNRISKGHEIAGQETKHG